MHDKQYVVEINGFALLHRVCQVHGAHRQKIGHCHYTKVRQQRPSELETPLVRHSDYKGAVRVVELFKSVSADAIHKQKPDEYKRIRGAKENEHTG